MLCVNWVSAGFVDDHECVSDSTSAEQEEEVMARDLDYEICIWCFVTRLNQTMEGEEIKIVKCHEIVNMAIAEAISKPFWQLAHTAKVHVDSSGCSLAHDTQKVGCEQRDEGLGNGRETCVSAKFVDGGDNEVFDE